MSATSKESITRKVFPKGQKYKGIIVKEKKIVRRMIELWRDSKSATYSGAFRPPVA